MTLSLRRATKLDAQADHERTPPIVGLPIERLAQVRDRIATGFYEQPEVVREIALRILESGDLPPAA